MDAGPIDPAVWAAQDVDGDGLSNGEEGLAPDRTGPDTDGDGIPDGLDADSDGDGIPDRIERTSLDGSPTDSDSDGLPDFRDLDSDNDAILDAHEYIPLEPDADGDGFPNYLDGDSDGDGIDDWTEAGDVILDSRPGDSDRDFVPDFRDEDSDDDGLEDRFEAGVGADRVEPDGDGDGSPDLVEVVAGTDPGDAESTPAAAALLPRDEAPQPPSLASALTFLVPDPAPASVRAVARDVSGGLTFVAGLALDVTTEGCASPAALDQDGDGRAETAVSPAPGDRLCWTLEVAPNTTLDGERLRVRRGCPLGRASFDAELAAEPSEGPAGTPGVVPAVVPPELCLAPDAPRDCAGPETCLPGER